MLCKPPKQQLGRGRGGFNRGNNPFDTPTITGDGDATESDDYPELSTAMPRLPESTERNYGAEETAGTVPTTAATSTTMSALATTEDAVESDPTSLTDVRAQEGQGELASTSTEWLATSKATEEAHEESVYYTCSAYDDGPRHRRPSFDGLIGDR